MTALRALGGAASNDEIETHVAAALGLSEAQRTLRHGQDGTRTELGYRLAWARTRLKEAGVIVGDGHGRWRIK
ncbi:MAG: winged helix-turn-helix domain-containing protein [Myxococcales bacterium]|nr:winged helix-turn-helix domain-containing protein [Myxococcales bacterium]